METVANVKVVITKSIPIRIRHSGLDHTQISNVATMTVGYKLIGGSAPWIKVKDDVLSSLNDLLKSECGLSESDAMDTIDKISKIDLVLDEGVERHARTNEYTFCNGCEEELGDMDEVIKVDFGSYCSEECRLKDEQALRSRGES